MAYMREEPQRRRQPQACLGSSTCQRPFKRRPQIVILGFETFQPGNLLAALKVRLGSFRERRKKSQMARENFIGLTALGQLFEGVLPEQFVNLVTPAGVTLKHRFVDKG